MNSFVSKILSDDFNTHKRPRRRKWLGFLVIAFVLMITVSVAQAQARIPRIGYISGTGDSSNPGPYVEALRQGLRAIGYVEGKHYLIEYRGDEDIDPGFEESPVPEM